MFAYYAYTQFRNAFSDSLHTNSFFFLLSNQLNEGTNKPPTLVSIFFLFLRFGSFSFRLFVCLFFFSRFKGRLPPARNIWWNRCTGRLRTRTVRNADAAVFLWHPVLRHVASSKK